MEETLGKRIAANRKQLGITQDRLAEQLGVTAQAVSKWENDQSCPDITMLPKLAEIFGISVDTLLGVAPRKPILDAEVVSTVREDDTESEGINAPKGAWEFHWNAGKKSKVWFAVWVLLMGGMMLFNLLTHRVVGLWDMIWPSALLLFGLSGLYPKFSFFSLGCALFGGYSLMENMEFTGLGLSSELLLIIGVLLFGLSLLVDALRSPGKPRFFVRHNGKSVTRKTTTCTLNGESFESSAAFSEDNHYIDLPRLHSGSIDVSFGELTVDLSGCGEFAPGCHIDADCSFGELTILVPRRFRAEVDSSSAFGSVDILGSHDIDASCSVCIDADVSFGEITIRYI